MATQDQKREWTPLICRESGGRRIDIEELRKRDELIKAMAYPDWDKREDQGQGPLPSRDQ